MTVPAEDDERLDALRVAAVAGDADAMQDLLAALTPLVERRCSKFLPCPADAEEAVQETLIVVATRLGTFAGRGSFVGWVNVVAANCARATYGSLKRRGVEQGLSGTLELPETADPRTTSVIAGSRLDLLEALDALERAHPELVAPVVLRDLADLAYAEVAAQTGVPLGTVKSRIHDARAFLRRRLLQTG